MNSGLARSVQSHRWLWALGSAVFALLLVVGLREGSRPRTEGMGMTGGTGGVGEMNAGAPAQDDGAASDAETLALEEKLARDPHNLELQLDLADLSLRSYAGFMKGFQLTKSVLARDPDNARALVQQARVRNVMGMRPTALELVDRVLARNPTMAAAWVERGRAAAGMKRGPLAVESFERAIVLQPGLAVSLDEELDAARGLGDGSPEAAAVAHPARSVAPTATEPAPADPTTIRGTMELDPSLAASVLPNAFVFVFVKDESGAPMPIAAKRLPARFPLEFTIGPGDALAGKTIPEHARVEARLDTDGNATTRTPTDPVAHAEHVAAGTTGLRLTLRAP